MRWRSSLAVLLALAGFTIGCEDKSQDPDNTRPVIASINISVPSANFSDTCNAPAYSYASLAQAMVQYATVYTTLPGGTQVNGVWTWTITEGTLTVTMTARRLGDGSYEWKLILNGTDGSDTYANWTAFMGTTSADGKSGTLTFYDDSPTPSTDVDVRVIWSTNASNVATIEFESVSDNMKFILTTNGTSGEVRTYIKSGTTWVADGYHAVWTAPGALATC